MSKRGLTREKLALVPLLVLATAMGMVGFHALTDHSAPARAGQSPGIDELHRAIAADTGYYGSTVRIEFDYYDWTAGGPDPSNGRPVHAVTLVALAPDGASTLFAGKYSFDDGTVFQTQLQASGVETVRYSPPRKMGLQSVCESSTATAPVSLGLGPNRVNAASLSTSGFAAPADVPAGEQLTAGTSDRAWQQSITDGAFTTHLSVVFDSGTGLLRSYRATQVGPGGEVVYDHWETYGSPQVVDATPEDFDALTSSISCKA
jgi:hypothetical protein